MAKLRVASMFAGIGGICLGFKQADCEIVWANEINSSACKTYRHNFGNDYLIEGDVCNISANSIPKFDILTAGFPCQSFSIGGKQKGFEDNRGALFFEVARIINTCRPPIVFLENVENLIKHDNGRTFHVIYNVLAQNDYSVRYKVMSSHEYGNVPQARKRIYIVAFSKFEQCDMFTFPKPIPLEHRITDIINPTEQKKDVYYYKCDTEIYKMLNSFIGNRQQLFRIYKGQIRNLKNPELCPTLTASMTDERNAVVLRDDYGIRRLTLREVLDFQGFTSEYFFPKTITLTNAYRQIGNSVSVPVIRRIAKQIQALH